MAEFQGVMGCHDLSCFPCRAVMRCGPSWHGAVGSGPASGPFSGVFRLHLRGMAFLLSDPVLFHPPAGGGTLIRAQTAPAPAPLGARFAPARFARLIARARPRTRAGRRAHLTCWPNRGLFRTGARRERIDPARMPVPCLHCNLAIEFRKINIDIRIKIKIFRTKVFYNPAAGRSPFRQPATFSRPARTCRA